MTVQRLGQKNRQRDTSMIRMSLDDCLRAHVCVCVCVLCVCVLRVCVYVYVFALSESAGLPQDVYDQVNFSLYLCISLHSLCLFLSFIRIHLSFCNTIVKGNG